jgi:diguanylate cyclase (GGDEF)-like protein
MIQPRLDIATSAIANALDTQVLLVCNDTARTDRVFSALTDHEPRVRVAAVPGLLMALGRLIGSSVAGAQQACVRADSQQLGDLPMPRVVIVADGLEPTLLEQTVATMARLSPGSPRVVVSDSSRVDEKGLLAAGIDRVVWSLDNGAAILSGSLSKESRYTPITHQAGADVSSNTPTASLIESTATTSPSVAPPLNAVEPSPDASSTPSPLPADVPAPDALELLGLGFGPDAKLGDATTVDDHDLGDTDLLDHLLARRGPLLPVAMRMLAARSGLIEPALAKDESAVPQNCVTSPVSLGQWSAGLLHARSPADLTALASWAQWLARWLAMEHRTLTLWDMALRDELTGAWNRRYFNGFLDSVLRRAVDQRSQVTLLVFDIDNFKHYNDRYGHPAGDEILCEAARLMQSVVRTHDVVARIGGDEFAVIFWDPQGPRTPNSQHPHDVRKAAERFQRAIAQHRFPKLGSQAPGALTISGGLASFPWDGRTAAELIDRADAMALQAKSQGKNAIQFGPGAERGAEQH